MINLKEYRQQSNLTQTQVAMKLGVVKNTVSQWETGVREPSINFLIKLADIFKISVDDLVGVKKIEENIPQFEQINLTEEQQILIEKIKVLDELQVKQVNHFTDQVIALDEAQDKFIKTLIAEKYKNKNSN